MEFMVSLHCPALKLPEHRHKSTRLWEVNMSVLNLSKIILAD